MTARAAAAAAAFVGAALMGTACSGGGHHPVGVSGSSTTAVHSTVPGATSSTSTGTNQLPTAFDCGGGAYEPAALIVVCGVGSTMATSVHWTAWSATGAAGTGLLAVPGHPPEPASLALSGVVATGSGPQFSRLQATWTGPSPDGRATEVFSLATAP